MAQSNNHPNRAAYSIPVSRKLIADLLEHFGPDPVTQGWCHSGNTTRRRLPYVVEILDETKEPEGANLNPHSLTPGAFANGLRVMAREYPHMVSQLLDANQHDAPLADLFVQCCIFGEEKYA